MSCKSTVFGLSNRQAVHRSWRTFGVIKSPLGASDQPLVATFILYSLSSWLRFSFAKPAAVVRLLGSLVALFINVTFLERALVLGT